MLTKEQLASGVWIEIHNNRKSDETVKQGTIHIGATGVMNLKKNVAAFVKEKSLLQLRFFIYENRKYIVFSKSKETEGLRFDNKGKSVVIQNEAVAETFGKNVDLEYRGEWVDGSLFLEIISSKPVELSTHRGRRSK